jgi:peptidylprolyl isomerase
MTKAKSGDIVRIHYTGMLTDGTKFDSSKEREPLQFEVGAGKVLPGLDKQVVGMSVGDVQTIKIPAEEAFGQHDPHKIQKVPRSNVPADLDVRPGTQLQAQSSGGTPMTISVVDVNSEEITVDANHPLAGRDVVFEVELTEIVKAA